MNKSAMVEGVGFASLTGFAGGQMYSMKQNLKIWMGKPKIFRWARGRKRAKLKQIVQNLNMVLYF